MSLAVTAHDVACHLESLDCGVSVFSADLVHALDHSVPSPHILSPISQDKLADDLENIDDVKKIIPGAAESLVHWLKMYKSTSDPPIINKIAFEETPQDHDFAVEVIEECHEVSHAHTMPEHAMQCNAAPFSIAPSLPPIECDAT